MFGDIEMNAIHFSGFLPVGKLFLIILLCGGLLAFLEDKLWALVGLIACLYFLFW